MDVPLPLPLETPQPSPPSASQSPILRWGRRCCVCEPRGRWGPGSRGPDLRPSCLRGEGQSARVRRGRGELFFRVLHCVWPQNTESRPQLGSFPKSLRCVSPSPRTPSSSPAPRIAAREMSSFHLDLHVPVRREPLREQQGRGAGVGQPPEGGGSLGPGRPGRARTSARGRPSLQVCGGQSVPPSLGGRGGTSCAQAGSTVQFLQGSWGERVCLAPLQGRPPACSH